jgi:hypothetical protein
LSGICAISKKNSKKNFQKNSTRRMSFQKKVGKITIRYLCTKLLLSVWNERMNFSDSGIWLLIWF